MLIVTVRATETNPTMTRSASSIPLNPAMGETPLTPPASPMPAPTPNTSDYPASKQTHGGANQKRPWSPRDSAHLYGIDLWGQEYFSINSDGHVAVHPTRNPARSIDLYKLVDEIRKRDIGLPLLIRFTDMLKDRVEQMHATFSRAMKDHDYQGQYRCVYPVKVNQQRHVVEEILDFGTPYQFGLEAGSKPELLAVMGLVENDKTPIICNGFKDDEFIEA